MYKPFRFSDMSDTAYMDYLDRQRRQKERNPTDEEYRKSIEGKYWCEVTKKWMKR